MAKLMTNTKIMTNEVRFSYAHLTEAVSVNGGDPRYSASIIFPKSDTETYEVMQKAIENAVDQEAAETNNQFITEDTVNLHSEDIAYDFEAMMKEFSEVVSKLMAKDQGMSAKITTIVDNHLGKGKKVGDCTEEQAPQIDLILFDLKNLL